MYKIVLVLVWLKEVKAMIGCNRGDRLRPGPGRRDGLPPVPGTPSQQGSQGIWDGWTNTGRECSAWFSKHHAQQQQQPQQQQANVSENAQGFASTTSLDASGQGYPVQGCQQGKMAGNARTGTSMVWCAMDSPTRNVYAAANSASACTEFWFRNANLGLPNQNVDECWKRSLRFLPSHGQLSTLSIKALVKLVL